MKLVSNLNRKNHRNRIVELISKFDSMVLCSGWMKHAGLKKILPALKIAQKERNAQITIFSNIQHTDKGSISALSTFKHVLVDEKAKYLHTKLYYFYNENDFVALIGSANITLGGLVSNDELSVEISGAISSQEHLQVASYMKNLESYIINKP